MEKCSTQRCKLVGDYSWSVRIRLVKVLYDVKRVYDGCVGRGVMNDRETVISGAVSFDELGWEVEFVVESFDVGIFNPFGLVIQAFDVQREPLTRSWCSAFARGLKK